MPSYSASEFHGVRSLRIEKIFEAVNGVRWQRVMLTMKDGSQHSMLVFLEADCNGFPFRENRDGVRAQMAARELLGSYKCSDDEGDSEGGLL